MPAHSSRGIALPLAVFALVMVGALVSGAFFVGRQEQALGRNSVKAQQAFAAAEGGAQRTVVAWVPDRYNTLAPGSSAAIGGRLGSTGWYRGDVRRLNPELFLVRSEGFSHDSSARQHVGLLVRLSPVEIEIAAALTTAAAGRPAGWTLDGADTRPAGWDCPPAGPGVVATRSAGDSMALEPLAALATRRLSGRLVIEPVVADGVCDLAVATNWGSPSDPAGPCGGHFPIIWSETSLTLTAGEGQGVLIVNGDLEVQGGFRFFGPVVVRGDLRVGGAGAEFLGGVIATRALPAAASGPVAVRYSRCVLDRALGGSARPALLRERSWVNLY